MNGNKIPPTELLSKAYELAKEVAMGTPNGERLNHAYKQLPDYPIEHRQTFDETFITIVRATDELQFAWVNALREDFKGDLAQPANLLFSPNKRDIRQLEAQIRGWQTEEDPLIVWHSGYVGNILFHADRFFHKLSLLRRIDFVAWCSEFDALPSLDFMDSALSSFTHVRNNRALVEELLRLAPPVFDANGRWCKSRSVLALFATNSILEHAQFSSHGISRDEEMQERAVVADLVGWMRKAFGILLERPDGKRIAFAYLGHLAHKELNRNSDTQPQAWIPEQQAFHALAEVLGAAGSRIQDARDAWTAAEEVAQEKHRRANAKRLIGKKRGDEIPDNQGEGGRTLRGEGLPHLFGVSVVLGDEPTTNDAEAFWSWLVELLVGRDPGLSLARQQIASDLLPPRFGRLLARLPNPVTTFQHTYRKLEPQRRRTLFSNRYERAEDEGSMLLIELGLHAALELRQCEEPSITDTPAITLFWWVYEAARRLWLTEIQRWAKDKQELVCLCFAFMPHLFGEHLGDALTRAIPPIANDVSMVCSAASWLFRNGIAPESLVPLFREAGANLEGTLLDAYQWASLTEYKSPDFPKTFVALANAIGLALAPADEDFDDA